MYHDRAKPPGVPGPRTTSLISLILGALTAFEFQLDTFCPRNSRELAFATTTPSLEEKAKAEGLVRSAKCPLIRLLDSIWI